MDIETRLIIGWIASITVIAFVFFIAGLYNRRPLHPDPERASSRLLHALIGEGAQRGALLVSGSGRISRNAIPSRRDPDLQNLGRLQKIHNLEAY